jgi:mono/diheme cytochrome c family protein
MPKLLLVAIVAFIVWCISTLGTIRTQTTWIREGHERVEATRAAFTSTVCLQCHGPESGNMLPIRRSLNPEGYFKWVRGLAPFHGYTTCPPQSAENFSEAEISRTYRILYGK